MTSILRSWMAGIFLAVTVLLSACSNEPEPIFYGEDQGAHCRMTIADDRFATEIVSVNGRAIKFDSIECLMSYVQSGSIERSEIASVWVIGADSPGTLILAENAHFVKSQAIKSPMGGGLIAFASVDAANDLATEVDGIRLSWTMLQENFTSELTAIHR